MQQNAESHVYRIIGADEWATAQSAGEFVPDRFDLEGFVHLSGKDQVLRPANLLYKARDDLSLLVIEVGRLIAELVYEPGSHGETELFPHLYGHLNVDAVVGVIAFPSEPDGSFKLPLELRTVGN